MTLATGGRSGLHRHMAELRRHWPCRLLGSSAAHLARWAAAHLVTVLSICMLAACAAGQPSVRTATDTPQPPATRGPSTPSTPRLVYTADWSQGLAGWTATPGWTVTGGALQSDTGDNRELISPFQPTTPDYAVAFRLQIISVPQSGGQYALSADPGAGLDGYDAVVDHLLIEPGVHEFADHPNEMITIDPMADQDPDTLQVHDFEPGTTVRTYRVEVRGANAALLIDGKIASQARSTKSAHLSEGLLRFSCSGVALRLSDFQVYSL